MALMHPGKVPTLLRVARHVLPWIEPFLYQVIRVRVDERSTDMLNAFRSAISSKPPEFFYAVRHLALEMAGILSRDEAIALLRLCRRVTNFSSSRYFTDSSLIPVLAEMRIQRLSSVLKQLFGTASINLAHPLFRSVTHLHMFGVDCVAEILADVPTLPALTHLCLYYELWREIVLPILAECPRLQLLLVQWPAFDKLFYEAARIPYVYDVRFVIGMYVDYWEEWEVGARGLPDPDLWTQADNFLARKRNGEIEATRYWLT
ncbi:hypothetical protein B0H19DRAFT_187085 [Mycena capillaripes]|nr:hypothetical protein B0H19DRAFT_187085 [Mycena capillaripes]